MPTSLQWRRYFEKNSRSLLVIPWQVGADLMPEDANVIERSLKEFQAGESSEGKHLLGYAQAYADREADWEYIAAVRLFIAEEQRHARDLGRFLTLNGIRLAKTTFTDYVFRRLRNLVGNLEVSISVLITAELIAKVYYALLQNATSSTVLRCLCDQILGDELRHVQFQAEQLRNLRSDRSRTKKAITVALQQILYCGTVLIVWIFHQRVIRRGGFSCLRWWRSCWCEFNAAFTEPLPNDLSQPTTMRLREKSAISANQSCS